MIRQLTISGALVTLFLGTLFFVTAQENTLGQQAGAQSGGIGGGGGGGIGGGDFGIGGAGGGGFGGGGIGGGGFGGAGGIGGRPSQSSGRPFPQVDLPLLSRSGGAVRRRSETKVSAAQRNLMQAESDEARETATEELKAALVAEFDADLEHRGEELEKVKQRLAQMETVLEKRAAAKDDIIDLRLEVLVKEAEGLGWSEEPRKTSGRSDSSTFFQFPAPQAEQTPQEDVIHHQLHRR